MNTEQERADFEAWHEERYGEPAGEFKSKSFYDNHEVQAEWRGWQARAALQSQPQETIAYMTRNEEGDPAMLFFDLKEARLYCNPDEEPEALMQAGPALQSQDREDAERVDFIEANPGWLRVSRLGHRTKQMWACVSPFTDYEHDLFKTAREAIDHARRVEEAGE